MNVCGRDDPEDSPLRAGCLWRDVFNHLTSRWALLVLFALADGPVRFHVLRDRVEGISEKMLSQTLKALVRDGLVMRHVEPTVPPRVSYELTKMGNEISLPLNLMSEWIGQNLGQIAAAQQQYDGGAGSMPVGR